MCTMGKIKFLFACLFCLFAQLSHIFGVLFMANQLQYYY